jgi:hypothetical protein
LAVIRGIYEIPRTSKDGERVMDFVERIFGISPDGGNGTFELMLFAIPVLMAGLVFLVRRLSRRNKPD